MSGSPFQLPGEEPRPAHKSSEGPRPPRVPGPRARNGVRTWLAAAAALIVGIWLGNATGGDDVDPVEAETATPASGTPGSCLSALDLATGGDTASAEFKAAAEDCRSKAVTGGAPPTAGVPATGGAPPATGVPIGQPAKDGRFTFVVHEVNCGETVIGDNEFTRAEAQGVFCLVEVTVSNHSDEAQELSGSAQKLIDSQGRTHDHSDEAWLALDQTPFFEQINPGNQIDGTFVFDVPEGTKVAALELHDSLFSGGVRVAVP